MPGLNLPIGTPLNDWRVETWFELGVSTSERGGHKVIGYYLDKELAEMHGKGKGWWGGHGKVSDVLVLTNDGKTGYVISMEGVKLVVDTKAKKEVMDAIKEKLTQEERKFLGME